VRHSDLDSLYTMQVVIIPGGENAAKRVYLDLPGKPQQLGPLFQDLELRLKDPRVAFVVIDSLANHLSGALVANNADTMQRVMKASRMLMPSVCRPLWEP
jgi:hypothetical protein